jgi:hypothetical protein
VSRALAVAALGVGLALAAPSRPPQGFLDQGTFLITSDDNEIGREEFAVRATPGRQGLGGVQAVATVRYRDRDYRAALELTTDRVPVSYQGDATAAGRVVERLIGQCGRGRCAVRVVTQAGEVAHEFPVPPGFVVLDDDTFDQFSFLPRATGAAPLRVMVLRPRETRVVAAEIRAIGPDSVVIADRSVAAEHYSITLPGSDVREFWVSPAGDLLKVSLPGRSVTATRSSLPAH